MSFGVGFIELDNFWETAALPVASLSVLDRLAIAISKLGARKIWIHTHRSPSEVACLLTQTRRRKIDIFVGKQNPFTEDEKDEVDLVWIAVPKFWAAAGDFITESSSERQIWKVTDPFSDRDTHPVIGRFLIHSSNELQETLCRTRLTQASFTDQAILAGESRLVRDPEEAAAATRKLWEGMTSSHDGLVDKYFNRPVGRPLAKWLVGTPVTPNQVTLFATALGLLGAWWISRGSWGMTVAGGILFQFSAVIDCIDGDLARAGLRETRIGKWLDIGADQVVHIAVFLAVAKAVLSGEFSYEIPALILGGSAAAGALLSFAATLWVLLSRSPASLAQRLVDSMANRDFSVLVLMLAMVGRLDLFLWMVGIGSHVFWLMLFSSQSLYPFRSDKSGVGKK